MGAGATPCSFEIKGGKLSIKLDKAYGLNDNIDVAIGYSWIAGTRALLCRAGGALSEEDALFSGPRASLKTRGTLAAVLYDYPEMSTFHQRDDHPTVPKPLFRSFQRSARRDEARDAAEKTTYHWKMNADPHVSYLISLAGTRFRDLSRPGWRDLPLDYYVAKHVDEANARRFMGHTPEDDPLFRSRKSASLIRTQSTRRFACPTSSPAEWRNITAHDNDGHRATRRDRHSRGRRRRPGRARAGTPVDLGDYLTCKDWSHVWLNEGFATYFAALFAEEDQGAEAFRLDMHRSAAGYQGPETGCIAACRSSRLATNRLRTCLTV